MKIIKMGYPTLGIGICSICNCEFEYDSKDLQNDNTLTSLNTNKYVICPCCGNKIQINKYFNSPVDTTKIYCCNDDCDCHTYNKTIVTEDLESVKKLLRRPGLRIFGRDPPQTNINL